MYNKQCILFTFLDYLHFGINMSKRKSNRVAIIGAGPSGMSLLRAFALAEKSGIEIRPVSLLRKTRRLGRNVEIYVENRSGRARRSRPQQHVPILTDQRSKRSIRMR